MPSARVGEGQGGAERAWDPMLGDFLAARQPVSRELSLTGLAETVMAATATSKELQQWRPFTAGEGRGVQRRLYQGRDWSYRLKYDALPGRPATERAELFTKLWNLNKVAPGAKVIACIFKSAVARVQKHLRKQRRDPQEVYTWKIPWKLRDELQLVFYPGTVLPTSVAEHDNVPWFSGPRMRQPRFMLSAELGQKMGYDTQQVPYTVLFRRMTEDASRR